MAFLSDAELASMRAEAAKLLADTCTLSAPAETVDANGSPITTWTDTAGVPCKLAAAQSRTGTEAGSQYSTVAEWVLSVAHDRVVSSGYRVTLGADTYEVIRVEDDQTWRAVRRAYLRRLD